MNKLTKRLRTIAHVVTGKVICDVGCDHGKLTEYLLSSNKVNFAYVSDISQESLDKAINLLSSRNLPYKAICTDGLIGYAGIENIDECIISGMGGHEIINIIKSSPIDINSFVLSPQHNIIDVKEFMLTKNYDITFDIIIKDKHKFYNIFKCQKISNKINYSKYDLMFGKDNFTNRNSDIKEYIEYELCKLICLSQKVSDMDLNEKIELFKNAKKELEKNE